MLRADEMEEGSAKMSAEEILLMFHEYIRVKKRGWLSKQSCTPSSADFPSTQHASEKQHVHNMSYMCTIISQNI